MKILIINGPNLSLTGIREQEKYGNKSFEDFFTDLKNEYQEVDFEFFQSNSEGEIIDKLHEFGFICDGIILNPGAYTHYSYAIADAISAIQSLCIEVHLSNIFSHEEFRSKSVTASHCAGMITGFKMQSYRLAVEYLLNRNH